MRREVYIRP